jgi:hypothetical protein
MAFCFNVPLLKTIPKLTNNNRRNRYVLFVVIKSKVPILAVLTEYHENQA